MSTNGWRKSIPSLKVTQECWCKHCSEWMGRDHNYEDYYINSKGFDMRCGSVKNHYFDMNLYNELSEKYLKEGE